MIPNARRLGPRPAGPSEARRAPDRLWRWPWRAPAAVALGSSRGPTSVGVSEREWRVSLYRTRVPTGVLRLNVHNYGEDGHDLAVRNRDGRVLAAVPEVSPGAGDTLRVRLRRRAATWSSARSRATRRRACARGSRS